MSWEFINYEKKKETNQELWEISVWLFFNISIDLCAEHSSRREDRERGQNEQSRPEHHTKRKFQVMEILAGLKVQPTRPSPTTISLSPVLTTSVSTSIHSIETSTRSTLGTRKAADPLPQTKSPTRTFVPFSDPSTKIKETAVHSDTGEKKGPIRNKRWHPKNETRNMTEALTQSSGVSPTWAAGTFYCSCSRSYVLALFWTG